MAPRYANLGLASDPRRYFNDQEFKVLTEEQMWVYCCAREGWTYKKIELTWPIAIGKRIYQGFIRKCIHGCIKGNACDSKPGRSTLISDVDAYIFFEEVNSRAESLNCIALEEACTILDEIMEEREERMRELLIDITVHKRDNFEVPELSVKYISEFMRNHGYFILNPAFIEEKRQECCHFENVRSFYDKFNLNGIPPELLFNADETPADLDLNRKVITPNGFAPRVTQAKMARHVSVMICFNAAGVPVTPFVILPGCLKHTPEDCKNLEGVMNFGTSNKGYMTKNAFDVWCAHFAHWISQYRVTLPPEIADKEVVLLLDGHPSRINYKAISYLHANHIRVIIFPSNMTSIIQPYDVYVAHNFKNGIRSALQSRKKFLDTLFVDMEGIPKIRGTLVNAILFAWAAICHPGIFSRAFAVTGIYPWNPAVVLNDPSKVRPTTEADRNRVENSNRININCSELTSDEWIIKLYFHELQLSTEMNGPVPTLPYDEFRKIVLESQDRALTPIEPFYLRWENVFQIVKF